MANIKKINGYDIIDSKFYKATATINSLVADDNDVEVILPTGWDTDDTFIIGGYYKLYDTNNELVIMRHIYSETKDISTGDITSSNEISYFNSKIYATFVNNLETWIGYKVVFTILLYNKE